MREISSKDNKIFKLCQLLSAKKHRDKYGKYLLEGINLIEEAIKNDVKIETVLVRRGTELPFEGLRKDAFLVEERLFDRLAQTETSQGLLAIVKKPDLDKADYLTKSKASTGNFVVLDRLQDPGNIGTILRTADGAGYELAVVMKGTADIFSPKVVRAATGSLFRMPVVFMESNQELVEFTRAAGRRLVATSLDAKNYYYHEDLTERIALIIGNEGNGVSEELINSSEIKIKIPMSGNIESLNAAVAAGILMYEAVRGKKG